MAQATTDRDDEFMDFETDSSQWDRLDDEGEFAWNSEEGEEGIELNTEEPVPTLDETTKIGFQSDEISLPPERVRFATLVNIKRVGADSYFEGVIVNLSTDGVACVTAATIEKDDRVWITFRLGLVDSPLSILCEVAWKRDSQGSDP